MSDGILSECGVPVCVGRINLSCLGSRSNIVGYVTGS